jgi:hypothetical protein
MNRNKVYDTDDIESLIENVPPHYKEDTRLMTFNIMKHEAYNNPEYENFILIFIIL